MKITVERTMLYSCILLTLLLIAVVVADSGIIRKTTLTVNGVEFAAATVHDGSININTATKEELMLLPGIGESRATDIIAHREQHGDFKTKESLKDVNGIGDGILEDIYNMISV